MIYGDLLSFGGGGVLPKINVSGLLSTDSVVATMGSKTKVGVWKTDKFVIPISDFGTWSVTATSGVKTKTISVNVDTVREYDVEWDWRTYLYNLGDECESLTGGWTSTGYTCSGETINNTNVVKNTNSISVGGYASRVSVIGTTNMIDLTNYTKLYYTLNHNTANNPWLGILNGKDVNTNRVTRVLPADTGDVTYYIDVSSYSTSYYVVVPNTQQSASSTGYFTKVWLE